MTGQQDLHSAPEHVFQDMSKSRVTSQGFKAGKSQKCHLMRSCHFIKEETESENGEVTGPHQSPSNNSLASHLAELHFSQEQATAVLSKRDLQIWSRSYFRPLLLKLKHSWPLRDTHQDQLLSYHPPKARQHLTVHTILGDHAPTSTGFSHYSCPHSLQSC